MEGNFICILFCRKKTVVLRFFSVHRAHNCCAAMRSRSGSLAALPPTGSARAPRRYATRCPRATEQDKRPAGWQVRFIGWSASPVKSPNSATRRVLIPPKVLVLTDLNVPFGRQRLLLGVLRVLDVAVLCLGLEVVPGSAGSPPRLCPT